MKRKFSRHGSSFARYGIVAHRVSSTGHYRGGIRL